MNSRNVMRFPDISLAMFSKVVSGIIMCMRPSNERRRYNVTSSLIGGAHAQSDLSRIVCDNMYRVIRGNFIAFHGLLAVPFTTHVAGDCLPLRLSQDIMKDSNLKVIFGFTFSFGSSRTWYIERTFPYSKCLGLSISTFHCPRVLRRILHYI